MKEHKTFKFIKDHRYEVTFLDHFNNESMTVQEDNLVGQILGRYAGENEHYHAFVVRQLGTVKEMFYVLKSAIIDAKKLITQDDGVKMIELANDPSPTHAELLKQKINQFEALNEKSKKEVIKK